MGALAPELNEKPLDASGAGPLLNFGRGFHAALDNRLIIVFKDQTCRNCLLVVIPAIFKPESSGFPDPGSSLPWKSMIRGPA